MEFREINLPNGIFLWWEIGESKTPNYFIIQFRQNTTNPITFVEHLIGSNITINEDDISQIQSNLNKIEIISNSTQKINTTSPITITQIKLSGNVTGILIPNALKLDVRVLGSLSKKFDVLKQDLRYINWKTFDASQSIKLILVSATSREIRVEWNINQINNDSKCFDICYKIKNDTFMKGTNCSNM